MKIVTQRYEDDCGIAVVATIVQKSYAAVARACQKYQPPYSLSPENIAALLTELGQPVRISRAQKGRKIIEAIFPTQVIALIRPSREAFGHWIIADSDEIIDPEIPFAIPKQAYDYREWEIVRLLLPTSASAGKPGANSADTFALAATI